MPIWRGTVSTDWNTAGNWIPDVSGSGVPSNTTDAVFDVLSTLPCTTGNAGLNQRICRDLITTGHTGTLQIGSGTNGDLRVYRNATIGGTVITGSSYLSMYSGSTSTLNVTIGTTIPNFKIEPTVTSSTITLSNTTVVTNYFKSESLSGANVVFSAATAVELRISNIAGHIRTTTMGTNTTMRLMGGTFVNCILSGAIVLNTGATLTGTGTSGAELVFSGITSFNASAGTIVLPAISNTYRLGTGIGLAQGTLTLNMGTNELDYFYVTTANVGQAFLILQSDLIANKGFHTQFYGVRVTPNGFNIITKESVAAGNIGFSTSAKISFKGVPSANGFLGMGYISGSTLILTSPVTTGSLAKCQVIHFPTVSGAASYNVILSCTTFNSSYGLQFSPQTVGSVGSPVPIYGYGGMTGIIGQEPGFLNCLFEVDASSNDTYFLGFNLYTLAGEFRYLSTNTGAFDGSKGAITAASNGANGIIDFQGQSSPTKFINTISLPNFFSQLTLKSNLYVNDHIGTGDSGILQSGSSYTLYVMRNFTASVSTPARAYQPTIELIGSTAANFTCGTLLGNVVINKSGGATVTVTQSFTYGYATATTFTYTAGLVNFGATTITIGGNVTINNPLSIGNFSFNNVTLSNNASVTIQNVMNILGSLLCSGSATFAGTHGFTTNGFNCTTASAIITLQNADATYGSPLAAYNVTGPLILQGGSTTTRITLQASGRAEFTGAIALASPPALSAMTTAAPTLGTIRIGMTVSGRSVIPVGLQPFITDRPVISSGSGLNWFINKTLIANPVSAGTLLSAGFKAIFNLTNTGTNVNVGLVTTQDIDSNGGQTILAALSNGDDTATNTALYRTLNWGPLIAPSGSVYYTWVD